MQWLLIAFSALQFFLIALLLWFLKHKKDQLEARVRIQARIIKEQKITTREIIKAQNKERQHLSFAMQNGLGQILSVLKIYVQVLGDNLAKNESANKVYTTALGLVDNAVEEMNNVSQKIQPEEINSGDFEKDDSLKK